MDIDSLSIYKEKVNAELQKQFSEYVASRTNADELYVNLLKEMEKFIMRGGKRLRPYLLYLAYKGFGGQDDEKILPIAAALELLHNFLLIHDDIIDQDTVRYGGNNISGVYQDFFSSLTKEDAKRNANNVAILAGDISHLMSSRIIARSQIIPELKTSILNIIYDVTLLVAEGELVDSILSLGIEHVETSEERITLVYNNKTASYSFELPLRIGMLLANEHESSENINAIKSFAESLGIAYQLQDDVLGVFGNSDATGKTDDGDIREGKRTLLHAKALISLKDDSLKTFKDLYGKKDMSISNIETIRELLLRNGIKQSIEDLCEQYGNTALSLLEKFPIESQVKIILKKLIESFKNRIS